MSSFVTDVAAERPASNASMSASTQTTSTLPTVAVPGNYWQATPEEKEKLLRQFVTSHRADAVPILTELYRRETSDEVKASLLALLGESGDPRALDVLIAGSEPGNSKDMRLAAMNAIGELDDKRALPILRKYFADQDPEIRQEAEFEVEYISAPSAHSNTLPKTTGK